MDEVKQTLSRMPIFSELNADEIGEVKAITSIRTYIKRMNVFWEGDQREAVFFIHTGVLKAYKIDEEGNKQVISLLCKGEMFPHVGFFERSPYPATVEVIEDATLYVIRINDFEKLLIASPEIAIKVMKILGRKILELQNRVQDFISKDIQHRLIQIIINMALENGVESCNGVYVKVPITNQDLADMVGTSRESVSRVLTQLKKKKLIEANRQGVLIYDLEKLKRID
ncbi:Crp/Fnr family transcriptional regulator [Halalkalibacter okhensis]|uniref:Crp/Fnr family transcriptional regulator n=1 Tax=Halalkalibacter okhensis TaxID=333138 RepID=A0A0B0ICE7_9BACI|nr:Crp/Fnr family transcriptional regulator [Halalkalibacter okhensis]KHF38955.1 Crp/Fnr family transcriptional regulator [Halalkalibacter okhensis]